jgi:hypothetical protein
MLRYPTLNATTLRRIVSNRCSRNCSTPNLKIVSRLTHPHSSSFAFCVISEIVLVELMTPRHMGSARVSEGPNWVPRHWHWTPALGRSQIRLLDAGASIAMALKESRRWKGSRKWLPDAGASVSLALECRRLGNGKIRLPGPLGSASETDSQPQAEIFLTLMIWPVRTSGYREPNFAIDFAFWPHGNLAPACNDVSPESIAWK